MSKITKSIRKVALFMAFVIASTVIPGAVLSPAQADSVTKFDYASIYRTMINDEFTLRPNETLSVALSMNLDPFTSDGESQISANFAITPNISNVTYGSKNYNWNISGCSGPFTTATVTPCENASRINYYMFQNITNTSGSPITISTNKSDAEFTYGLTDLASSYNNISASRNVSSTAPEMSTGLVITSDDRSFYGSITLCLDSALVSAGDVLSWQKTVTIAGNPISDGWNDSTPYMEFMFGGNPLTDITLTEPLPTQFYVSVNGGNLNSSPGTMAMSIDLQKAGNSVLKVCSGGGGGGYTPPPPLFSLGGASVKGDFKVGSRITATPNRWSRTSGGAAVTTNNTYDWLVCSVAQATSTTSINPESVPCIGPNADFDFVLADGNSLGQAQGPDDTFQGPSLLITQNLLNALSGKHLMVVISGSVTSPLAYGNLFMKSCGPISVGLSCSSTFGTPAVVKKNQTFKALPKTAKAGKSVAISALTGSKVAVKVVVTGTGCKVAAVKDKKKKVVSHKLTMGKKNVTCTVTVTASGTAELNAFKAVYKVKAT